MDQTTVSILAALGAMVVSISIIIPYLSGMPNPFNRKSAISRTIVQETQNKAGSNGWLEPVLPDGTPIQEAPAPFESDFVPRAATGPTDLGEINSVASFSASGPLLVIRTPRKKSVKLSLKHSTSRSSTSRGRKLSKQPRISNLSTEGTSTIPHARRRTR